MRERERERIVLGYNTTQKRKYKDQKTLKWCTTSLAQSRIMQVKTLLPVHSQQKRHLILQNSMLLIMCRKKFFYRLDKRVNWYIHCLEWFGSISGMFITCIPILQSHFWEYPLGKLSYPSAPFSKGTCKRQLIRVLSVIKIPFTKTPMAVSREEAT